MHRTPSPQVIPRWVVITILALLAPGCDTADPAEEEAPLTRVELQLRRDGGPDVALASVRGDEGLQAGASVVADTLRLSPGGLYEGRIDLFDANGQNITGQVRQEAENYQVFYRLEGTGGLNVLVTDVESDYGANDFGGDLQVGLAYRLTVADVVSDGEGLLRVQVGRFDPGRKNGTTLNVAPIVDVHVPIKVDVPSSLPGPGAPELITRAILTLARPDSSEVWIVTANDINGLNLGANTVPNPIDIEVCTREENGPSTCTPPLFTEPGAITLTPGAFEGSLELFDEFNGVPRTAEIMDEAEWHRIDYGVNFGPDPFTIEDMDPNGLPLGLSFRLVVPTDVVVFGGGLRIALRHFDPANGDTKGETGASSQNDLQFRIPMNVHQNGPPESINRFVMTLDRADGEETITLTAIGEDVFTDFLDSLRVETCTGPAGQQTCDVGETLVLTREARYTGRVEVFDDNTGYPVMDEILREAEWHQFFFQGRLGSAFTITDLDAYGLPLGFQFEVDVRSDLDAQGSLRILLSHYGRTFAIKNGIGISQESDLDFAIPFLIM